MDYRTVYHTKADQHMLPFKFSERYNHLMHSFFPRKSRIPHDQQGIVPCQKFPKISSQTNKKKILHPKKMETIKISTSAPNPKNPYTLPTFSLLIFLLTISTFIFFFFPRTTSLQPNPSLYRDLFSQSPLFSSFLSADNATILSGTADPDLNFDDNAANPTDSVDSEQYPIAGNVSFGWKRAVVEEKKKILKWVNNSCDFYAGNWVRDEEGYYPIYKPGSCPFVDEGFDCRNNGRHDSDYLNWRWKPDGCDLPRFNATDFLVRIRGKRFMLVGDSMNRNQFESLLCLLHESLPNKSKMYETHGYKITKGRGYYIFKFEDYDCTVEFVRSHFLVKEGIRLGDTGKSNPTLSIDRIDKSANRWARADILVFNTGHWWTHGKTSRGKNYYKEGDYIYPKFDAVEAYRRALKTWANWIDKNMNPNKLVFYRGYSSAHFSGGDWDSNGSCNGETEPINSGAFRDTYPLKMKIMEEVIREMQFPVVLLNVTRLTNYRKDGHPSVYGKNVTGMRKVSTKRQDCSHWCLPGVPDAWNELIYATLVTQT